MDVPALPQLSRKFVNAISYQSEERSGKKVSVNPVVSNVAGFYEKIRTGIELQDEEVVFRSSIERILRRRLFFESDGNKVAWHLIRELAWAKYFSSNSFPEAIVEKIAEKVDLFLKIHREIRKKYKVGREKYSDWILQVMSADIAFIIKPNRETRVISDFMYHLIHEKVNVIDSENDESIDALIFISIKRALAHEDKAFLRFELFVQYFGEPDYRNFEHVIEDFNEGYKKIEETFNHPLYDRIYGFVKKQSVPFLILRDVLDRHRGNISEIISEPDKLAVSIINVCNSHYREIHKKIRRAIFRGVIFLLVTKTLFALLIEGTFEKFFYDRIMWGSLALNTLIPPFVMVLVLLFIRLPSKENSTRIVEKIKSILFNVQAEAIEERVFRINYKRNKFLYAIFVILWIFAIVIGLWGTIYVLHLLKINFISQFVFVFFMIIVSFLAFRINESAKIFNVSEEKDNFGSVIFNFFFMPFIHLGRRITLSFAKVNFFLIIFDFIIETPFKTVFAFMESWFSFLRSERERIE